MSNEDWNITKPLLNGKKLKNKKLSKKDTEKKGLLPEPVGINIPEVKLSQKDNKKVGIFSSDPYGRLIIKSKDILKKVENKKPSRCIYIEAPKEYKYKDKSFPYEEWKKSLFLAGGITNCPNWQQELVQLLKDVDLIIFNPRRDNFPIDDPNASYEQIKWEYNKFQVCKQILFWFSRGSLNPIVLFEYGRWSYMAKKFWQYQIKIFVGIDTEYKRKQDVEIQTKLLDPIEQHLKIVYSLEDLAKQIIDYNHKEVY